MAKRTEELCVPVEGQKAKVCAQCQIGKLKCSWKPKAPSKTRIPTLEAGSEKVKRPEVDKGKGEGGTGGGGGQGG